MAKASARLRLEEGQLQQEATREGARLVMSLQRRVVNSAKQRAPVDTGNMRNSIRQEPVRVEGDRVTGTVLSAAEYSMYVHDGTRPHIIRPRTARALAFTIGGQRVYAKSVRHPGTKARPFLRNAIEQQAPRLGFRVD